MAGLIVNASTGDVALVAGVAKTVLQIKAPANQRLMLKTLRMFGKGTSATDTPVEVRVTRSSANFGTGSALTVNKNNPSDGETIQSVVASNFTVEPTSPTDAGIGYKFHPQQGIIEPFPFEAPIEVPGGQSINVELTSAQTQTIKVSATYEE